MVVSQGKTKSDDLKDAKRRIEHVGGRIAGVVLNRVKVSSKKYDDRYYYYSSTSDYPSTRTRRHSHRFEDEDSRDDDYHEGREERKENNSLESKKTFESRDTSEVKEKVEFKKDSFEKNNNQTTTRSSLNINFEEPPKGVNSVPVTSEKAKEILEQLNRFKENNK